MILFCPMYKKRCYRTYCEKNSSCGLGGSKKPLEFETEEELNQHIESLKTKDDGKRN